MGEVADPRSIPARRRRTGLLRFHGHPFLTRWTPRRQLAVIVLFAIALAFFASLDPRIRAGLRYWRAPSRYTVPVTGVGAKEIRSSWHAPRPGGRKHKGIDIFAPRGTAVVSATDGVVWSVKRNRLGGNVVLVLGEGLAVYYYAHLDAWSPDVRPGDHIRAGTVLGSVGTSGNARTTPPHLHFSVTKLTLFGSSAQDPAPLLARGRSLPATILAGGVTEPPRTPDGVREGGRELLVTP